MPTATGNNYEQFVTTLKNLYGTIEISDKAIRASENNSGAFVNLLNAEMEGLIKASGFNFGRMLFGDGSGIIATVKSVSGNTITVDSVKNVIEGMLVDVREKAGTVIATGKRITGVDRAKKTITISGGAVNASAGAVVTVQGSFNNEITGLGRLFDDANDTLYGVSKTENPWLKPYVKQVNGAITEAEIQLALDTIEENSGSAVNFIVCSWGVRRALINLLSKNKRIVDVMNLEGGFKALSYNGVPIVADRFCPEGTMYLLNTDDFTLHQLCDWQWLTGDDGRILKQIPGKPVYTATLVKYADLICDRPYGQGKLTGITEE